MPTRKLPGAHQRGLHRSPQAPSFGLPLFHLWPFHRILYQEGYLPPRYLLSEKSLVA